MWRPLVISFAVFCVHRLTRASDTAIDYCLNESFNASCPVNTVILITTARFGRMRSGRCISGDFNVGCSKDIKPQLDGHCSARSSCDVSIRSLVDLHPCQRDFVSFLEASYKCVEASGQWETSCPSDGQLIINKPAGYLARLSASSIYSSLGTELCPWVVTVSRGQRVNLTIVAVDWYSASVIDDVTKDCRVSVVIDDLIGSRRLQVSVCHVMQSNDRRHLATSVGNRIRVHVTDDVIDGATDRVILLYYTAVGCPEVSLPANAWARRISDAHDNVMIRCNDSHETWYLACQGNRWIGDVGNCSSSTQNAVNLVNFLEHETRLDRPYSTNGVMMAVLFGIILGIVVGMSLLVTLHCIRRRSSANFRCSTTMKAGNKTRLMILPYEKELDELQPINYNCRLNNDPSVVTSSGSRIQTPSTPSSDPVANYSCSYFVDSEKRLEFNKHCGSCCHQYTAATEDYIRSSFRSTNGNSASDAEESPDKTMHRITPSSGRRTSGTAAILTPLVGLKSPPAVGRHHVRTPVAAVKSMPACTDSMACLYKRSDTSVNNSVKCNVFRFRPSEILDLLPVVDSVGANVDEEWYKQHGAQVERTDKALKKT